MSLVPPVFTPIQVPESLIAYRPVTDITPFTYRAGITYQELLERLRIYTTGYLTNYLTDEFGEFAESWEANLSAIINAVNTALSDQQATVAAELAQTLAEIVEGANAPLNDAHILQALNTAGSTSLAYLDNRYVNVDEAATSYAGFAAKTDVTRLKTRLAEQWFNVKDYGAVGDGVADDTAAVQSAINAALNVTDTVNWQRPPYNGFSPTVFFPMGTYLCDDIAVNGSVNLLGVGSYLYGSSMLLQNRTGHSILILGADTDGQTNSSVIEKLTFRSKSGTSAPNVAQIITADNVQYVSSMYIRNCWFESPENYAIFLGQGGDFEISGCTFDQAAFNSIKLGKASSATNMVNSSKIVNNTFSGIAVSCIELSNASGIMIANNRLINSANSTGANQCKFILTNNTSGTSVARFTANGNFVDGAYNFAALAATGTSSDAQGAAMTGNLIREITGSVVSVAGGGIYYGLTFIGNKIKNATAVLGQGSAFRAVTGTGLQVCSIAHNSVMAGAATALLFDMPDATKVQNNSFASNPNLNFTTENNFVLTTNKVA